MLEEWMIPFAEATTTTAVNMTAKYLNNNVAAARPRLSHSHEVLQQSYSIEYSQGEVSMCSFDLDDEDGSLVECHVQEESRLYGRERPQLKKNGLLTHTVNSSRHYHHLSVRSISPRPYLATQMSMRSAASSPGGLQYPLQQKLRKQPRARRQEFLIRTGAPAAISRSSSWEAIRYTGSSVHSRIVQLLHPQSQSVMELRRDSSILDRPDPEHLSIPEISPMTRLQARCCSTDDLDQALRKTSSSTFVEQSTVGSVPPNSQSMPVLAKTNHVLLHIYDLITPDTLMQLPFGCVCEIGKCFESLNDGLHLMGTGAYHVGVEVNGVEYAFGACSTPGKSGVFPCPPKDSPGYQYRTTIDFGERLVVRRSNMVMLQSDHSVEFEDDVEYLDGRDIIRDMAREYMGSDYDILRRNCCTFARDACYRLGIKDEEIPRWFSNLAESGAMTHDIALATVQPFSICEPDEGVREEYEIKMASGVRCST